MLKEVKKTMETRNILIALAIKHQGDWDRIYKDICAKNCPSESELEQAEGVKAITIVDENYPSVLKNVYKPPFVLFYEGDINLLNSNNIVAIMGAREPSAYSLQATLDIVDNNYQDNVIMTTLAKGISMQATIRALDNNQKTIVVLAYGLDIDYLGSQNVLPMIKESGLAITEYPQGTQPQNENFAARMRIISALANELAITEVGKQSGILIAVNYALQMGKDIYVLPQRVDTDTYNNTLISEGAQVLLPC